MLTVEEALLAVMGRVVPLPPRPRPLAVALGCTLAEDVAADRDSPPFPKALVDGYAVRAADLADGSRRLGIGEEIPAGRTPGRPLGAREAALIMTGAPLPHGADAVVMIERTRRDGEAVVIDDGPIAPGQNWLPRAREMRAGEVIVRRGERLDPVRLALLAAVGRAEAVVFPRPVVAVLPTGDELVEPDREPGPGQIRNSNATLLVGMARERDARAEALPIAPDDPDALRESLGRGLAADVLLITGGVSAGNRDLVPAALEASGVERVFHKVRVKPGKPLWFGVGPARPGGPGPMVFGLPGNPVSGLVGFLLFVRPALEALRGRPEGFEPLGRGRLDAPFIQRGDRATYHPARRLPARHGGDDVPALRPLDWAGSADLRPIADADGFAVFPAGDRVYQAGEVVDFLPIR